MVDVFHSWLKAVNHGMAFPRDYLQQLMKILDFPELHLVTMSLTEETVENDSLEMKENLSQMEPLGKKSSKKKKEEEKEREEKGQALIWLGCWLTQYAHCCPVSGCKVYEVP